MVTKLNVSTVPECGRQLWYLEIEVHCYQSACICCPGEAEGGHEEGLQAEEGQREGGHKGTVLVLVMEPLQVPVHGQYRYAQYRYR